MVHAMAEPMPSPRRARSAEPQGIPDGGSPLPAPQPVPGRADLCRGSQGAVPQAPVAQPASPGQGLTIRCGGDGSFSLWSEAFREGFHSGRGARREAEETFLLPSELERFPPGRRIRVLEVCVGTGCNLAVLLEACTAAGLLLEWTGLELDPEPLRLALGEPAFRAPWQPATLQVLEQLLGRGEWLSGVAMPAGERADGAAEVPSGASSQGVAERWPTGGFPERSLQRGQARSTERDAGNGDLPAFSSGAVPRVLTGHGRMLWGDARATLRQLQRHLSGPLDLIWHDAFSPQRCPQLWSVEFLTQLSGLLGPQGRWISYSSAAAVRETLQLAGLQLAALPTPEQRHDPARAWSGGTVASPGPLPACALWRALSPMEQEHLASGAGEPYRDPTGTGMAEEILANRRQAQAEALATGRRCSSSAWRRRWGVER
jgi:hypothetical protein